MNNEVRSDVFDGIQLDISQMFTTPSIDSANSGWVGDSYGDVNITISTRESNLIPWDCEIVFTQDLSYASKVESPFGIYDEYDSRLWFPNRIILEQSFDFSYFCSETAPASSTTASGLPDSTRAVAFPARKHFKV